MEGQQVFEFLLNHYEKQNKEFSKTITDLESLRNSTQRQLDILNAGIKLYYRNTQHSDRDGWKPAKLNWVIERDNPEYNLEVCIYVKHPRGFNHPWFVKNDKFGTNQLVLELNAD